MLTAMHPANILRGCAIKLREVLYSNRLWSKVRFADLAEDQAKQVGKLCEEVSRESQELETVIAAALADGKVTPEELDEIVKRLREIRDEAEEGRAI
jgi:hypothetical protein